MPDPKPKRAVGAAKYQTLDTLIIAKIKARSRATFTDLYGGAVQAECKRIAAVENETRTTTFGKTDSWRVLDRRLQALRRAGKITFTGPITGWSLITPEA